MEKDKDYDIVRFADDNFELEVSVSPKEETVWLDIFQRRDVRCFFSFCKNS